MNAKFEIKHRQSPLMDKAPAAIDHQLVTFAERPFTCKINLRGSLDDPNWSSAVRDIIGMECPKEPNQVARDGQRCLFWLGPNEWLLSAPAGEEAGWLAQFTETAEAIKAEGSVCAVTDVSETRTIIELSGPFAASTLNKACPLNFELEHFPADTVAQSYFGHAFMLYHRLPSSDDTTFHLYPLRSFASYVWDMLVDAAWEWQGAHSMANK